MPTTSEMIAVAGEYLHAELPLSATYTISASELRTLRKNAPIAKRFGGGRLVVGITSDGVFLPPIDGGPRNARLTVRAAATAAEQEAVLSLLRDEVTRHHPPGSAYDPAMASQYRAWSDLRKEIGA